MSKHKFKCHGCGKLFPHRPGATITCSKNCAEGYAKERAAVHDALTEAGFENIGNAYFKSGHTVTQEEIKHVGLEKALQRFTIQ